MKIVLISGTRPNIPKVAPLMKALDRSGVEAVLIHTGQHRSANMSDDFFKEFEILPSHTLTPVEYENKRPPIYQVARFSKELERVYRNERPGAIIVVGDVTSTLNAALVAVKSGITLVHVEAGLRSWDTSMPEEINRVLVDSISDILFCTEPAGIENLRQEHIANSYLVGNVMIDTLFSQISKLDHIPISDKFSSIKAMIGCKKYAVATIHRPSNVDNRDTLQRLMIALDVLSEDATVVLPVHPRLRQKLEEYKIVPSPKVLLVDPLAYTDFLRLWKDAAVVLTDSGGLQEETTALLVPCVTLRENTERPCTTEIGSSILVGSDLSKIVHYGKEALLGRWKSSVVPKLWDGHASDRIVDILIKQLT